MRRGMLSLQRKITNMVMNKEYIAGKRRHQQENNDQQYKSAHNYTTKLEAEISTEPTNILYAFSFECQSMHAGQMIVRMVAVITKSVSAFHVLCGAVFI